MLNLFYYTTNVVSSPFSISRDARWITLLLPDCLENSTSSNIRNPFSFPTALSANARPLSEEGDKNAVIARRPSGD